MSESILIFRFLIVEYFMEVVTFVKLRKKKNFVNIQKPG